MEDELKIMQLLGHEISKYDVAFISVRKNLVLLKREGILSKIFREKDID